MEDDSETTSAPPAEEGLKRDETSQKVVLSFSAKPVTSSGSAPVVSSGLKANPLKRPNVFKSSAPTTSENGEMTVNETKRSAPMSAAERLIIDEQERKRRRMDRDNLA